MSDEKTTTKRKVSRNPIDKLYYVYELQAEQWKSAERGYVHSTSAYAKLGRITSRESQR